MIAWRLFINILHQRFKVYGLVKIAEDDKKKKRSKASEGMRSGALGGAALGGLGGAAIGSTGGALRGGVGGAIRDRIAKKKALERAQ